LALKADCTAFTSGSESALGPAYVSLHVLVLDPPVSHLNPQLRFRSTPKVALFYENN